MFTIRDVITEALARSSLVSRSQPAPGNMVESAYRLLKGIASDYSKHNLLQFLRREVDLNEMVIKEDQYVLGNGYVEGVDFWFVESGETPPFPPANVWDRARAWNKDREVWKMVGNGAGTTKWQREVYPDQKNAMATLNGAVERIVPGGIQPVMRLGEIDNDLPNDWVQVPVENIACIKEVYWDRTNDPMANAAIPLQFVSFEDFNNGAYGDYIYTYQEITDTKVEIKFKPRFVASLGQYKNLKVIYNVKYEFNLDSTLRIPDIYQELFTAALTYALACEFPRLSPEHTERLKNTMKDLENSVKTPTRANKFVTREPYTGNGLYSMQQLDSGSFLFPG